MSIIGNILRFFVEMRANGQTYEQACQTLESEGKTIYSRMRQAPDNPVNRLQAGHIIGMERWGAHRLATLLDGTPTVMDEYDAYRPSADETLSALADEFQKARAETLTLAARLESYTGQKVAHNDLGEIGVKTWLVYLNNHASIENKRIK